MKNQLSKAFEGHNVTIITDEHGDTWFKGKDVCDILELRNVSQAISRLSDDDMRGIITNDTTGREQGFSFVSESGLYQLIFTSRMKGAKRFQKWVTSEVLPSIRKTGQYVAELTDDERIAKLATDSLKLIADKKVLQGLIEIKDKEIDFYQKTYDENTPKVEYAEAVEASQTDMLIGEYVRTLTSVRQIDLFELMRKKAIVYKKDGKWAAYASYLVGKGGIGWFRMVERPYTSPNGNKRTSMQLYITGKGRIKLAERLGLVNSNGRQLEIKV